MQSAGQVVLVRSPLAPERSPVTIGYQQWGSGPPVLILHGGWGQQSYSFLHAIETLAARYTLIAPDRSGYARSTPIEDLSAEFHRFAAAETYAVLDALDLRRVAVWGHSDGAVIAVMMALAAPDRIAGVVLEAMHLWGEKPSSREFFERAADAPGSFGERVAATLAGEHGPRWPQVVSIHGRAWLRIAERGAQDLYDGKLPDLTVPALVVHGARDPRTEPGELEAIRAALPRAQFVVLADGAHSPHSEPATAGKVEASVGAFLDQILGDSSSESSTRV
jgi:pimeloyl-ACP methyl ester carboxylesterase